MVNVLERSAMDTHLMHRKAGNKVNDNKATIANGQKGRGVGADSVGKDDTAKTESSECPASATATEKVCITESKPCDDDEKTLSKSAKKKRARDERWKAVKRARKANQKKARAVKAEEKRREREEWFNQLSEAEQVEFERERKEKLLEKRAKKRDERERVRSILGEDKGTRFEVCIDLGWNEEMMEKEQKSLCRQLMYSYNSIRKCIGEDGDVKQVPLKLTICGVDQHIEPAMDITANGWKGWPITVSHMPLTELYKSEGAETAKRLIYLSHDAEEVLDELKDGDVYVIGGLVDRNRLKGVTMEKAKALGIKAARLNLDANISLKHGTKVLTVNHCVDILLHRANGMSWTDAYLQVLPERKGIQSVDKTEQGTAENEDECEDGEEGDSDTG